LKKTEEGPVVYDKDICIGCRYCMIACPWEIPRYSWEDTVPYVQKCDMCYERIVNEGAVPACVEACPTQATLFGERDDLLREAHRRLDAEPNKYVQKVFGENEVGGTSVLYVSDIDLNLTDLATPIRDTAPMPHRTTKILHQMPLVFVLMAGTMGGINWIVERRQKLAAESAQHPEDSESGKNQEEQ
jgi:formate dehydrogenase iron-sulfur subunit